MTLYIGSSCFYHLSAASVEKPQLFFYIPKNQIKYGGYSEVFLSQMSPLRGEEDHSVATALRIKSGALTHAMQAFTRGIAS